MNVVEGCGRVPTPIAIAVVQRGEEFLIGQRPPDVALGGLWEFPGGKVQAGESPAQAVLRECLEETGLVVNVVREALVINFEYPHGFLRLHFYWCRCLDPSVPSAPFRWVLRKDLATLEFPAANATMVREILSPLASKQ